MSVFRNNELIDGTDNDWKSWIYKRKYRTYTCPAIKKQIWTNGKFSKAEMNKIASMTRNAYARCINPVGTLADGDTIYPASVGDVEADINVAGTLAAQVMERAIVNAIHAVWF